MKFKHSNYFGIRVKALERKITTRIPQIERVALKDVGIAVSQGLSSINKIIEFVGAKIKILKEDVSRVLDPEIHRLMQELKNLNITVITNRVNRALSHLKIKIGNASVDLAHSDLSYPWRFLWIFNLAIIVLSCIDSGCNYASFQVIAPNLLISIILSLSVAAGLSISAHIIGHHIRNAGSIVIKRVWFVIGLVGGGVIFFMLGYLRHKYLDEGSLASSPFLWMLFCNFFFMIAILLSAIWMPTEEQVLERKEYLEKKRNLQALFVEKTALERELEMAKEKEGEIKSELEKFRTYRDRHFSALDKEKGAIEAKCHSEFELRGGSRKSRA